MTPLLRAFGTHVLTQERPLLLHCGGYLNELVFLCVPNQHLFHCLPRQQLLLPPTRYLRSLVRQKVRVKWVEAARRPWFERMVCRRARGRVGRLDGRTTVYESASSLAEFLDRTVDLAEETAKRVERAQAG